MDIRWFGCALVVIGCGGVGFLMAYHYKRQINSLKQVIRAIDYMLCDLPYRQTPLPELIVAAAQQCTTAVRSALLELSRELNAQIAPDAASCMSAVLSKNPDIPNGAAQHLRSLGNCLGLFDLQGQIAGLQAVRTECEHALKELEENRPQRLRSYQTLGLCAGAALAILFV